MDITMSQPDIATGKSTLGINQATVGLNGNEDFCCCAILSKTWGFPFGNLIRQQ